MCHICACSVGCLNFENTLVEPLDLVPTEVMIVYIAVQGTGRLVIFEVGFTSKEVAEKDGADISGPICTN